MSSQNDSYRWSQTRGSLRSISRRMQQADRERASAARRRRASTARYPSIYQPGTGFPERSTRMADRSYRVHPRETAGFSGRPSPRHRMTRGAHDRIRLNRQAVATRMRNMRMHGIPVDPTADPYNRATSYRLGGYIDRLGAAGAYMARGSY